MDQFEHQYRNQGYKIIIGIDEVGRGPLAGPVCAAAVILPDEISQYLKQSINDSKKLSPVKRNEINLVIIKEAIGIGIGSVDNNMIDKINILEATKIAMIEAYKKLKIPDNNKIIILIDGNFKIKLPIEQLPIIKGDEKCYSVAAASIVAKVYRDSLMEEYHKVYPQYDFLNNKGYGSKKHIEAIKKFGVTAIHRKTFAKVKEYV